MNGNGSSATSPSRQSTPSVIIATTSTSVSVPSKAGEERFARRHLDGVDVVGRERHQVAGPLPMEERRTLQRQPRVELRCAARRRAGTPR